MPEEIPDRPREHISDKLRDRESRLRAAVVLAITGVVVWRIAIADFSRVSFSFSEFMDFVLALFSIGMSVVFYFKASETSNTFYDNAYRFAKDISDIVGRMEAGFGERLRHLNEDYSGLRDSISKAPVSDEAEAQGIAIEKETAQKLESERQRLLQDLADRAKLGVTDRERFFADLARKEAELSEIQKDVLMLERRLARERPLTAGTNKPAQRGQVPFCYQR